jgi:hypothetical protein
LPLGGGVGAGCFTSPELQHAAGSQQLVVTQHAGVQQRRGRQQFDQQFVGQQLVVTQQGVAQQPG